MLISAAARADVRMHLEQLRLVTEGKARRGLTARCTRPAASPDLMRRGFMEDLRTDPRVVYQNALALRGFDREKDLGRSAVRCSSSPATTIRRARPRTSSRRASRRRGSSRFEVRALYRELDDAEGVASALQDFLAELPR